MIESGLSCVSPGSRCGDGEWGEGGMVIEASSGGAGRTGGISQGDDRAGSSVEFEISNEDKTSSVESKGSDAGERSGRDDGDADLDADDTSWALAAKGTGVNETPDGVTPSVRSCDIELG